MAWSRGERGFGSISNGKSTMYGYPEVIKYKGIEYALSEGRRSGISYWKNGKLVDIECQVHSGYKLGKRDEAEYILHIRDGKVLSIGLWTRD